MAKRKPVPVQAPPIPSPWVLPAPLMALGILVWIVVVTVAYFQEHPLSPDFILSMISQMTSIGLFHAYMGKVIGSLAVALGLLWVGFQLGNSVLRLLLPAVPLNSLDRWALGSALGLGIFGLGTFLLGVAGFWTRAVFGGVLAVAALILLIKGRTPLWPPDPDSHAISPWRTPWIFLLAIFFMLFLLGESTPEVFYDALYYHIAVPNLYQIAHRVYDLPTLLFSNFVLTIQWLFGLAMTLGTELSAKFLHGAMALLTVATFLAIERRFLSPGSGWLASVLYISLPIVGINAITTGTDAAWAYLHIAATLAFIQALLTPERRWLILAGLLMGLSASCKYPGLPYIPIAMAVLIWKRRREDRQPWKAVVLEAVLFGACAMAVLAPMLIRNVAYHGNPLYPFGGTRWGHPLIEQRYWDTFISDANTRVLRNEFQSLASFWRYLAHPWYITISGQDNGTYVGPLYLLLLPLVFFFRSPSPAYRWLRVFTAILWLLWMVSTQTPRYGLPALGLASLVMAEAVIRGFQKSWVRGVVLAAVLAGALVNWTSLLTVLFYQGGWRVVGGLEKEDAFLAEMHSSYPTPPYSGFQWMNDNLPQGSKILIAGEARTHYTRHLTVPSSVPDPQPLVVYSKQATSAVDMAARMRADGVTHLFLNYMEATRTESYGLFPWDSSSWGMFNQFWTKYMELIWKEERFERGNPKALYVYRLKSEEEAARPHLAPPNPFERWKPK